MGAGVVQVMDGVALFTTKSTDAVAGSVIGGIGGREGGPELVDSGGQYCSGCWSIG
jgi:hypothetical protein